MSLQDIVAIDRERVRRERVVLHTIYDRMKNRVNMAAKARSQSCLYTIPQFIPGYPLVNVPKTMNYLLKKLKKEGFYAIQVDSLNIYIAWDPQAIRELDARLRGQEVTPQRRTRNQQIVTMETQKRDDDLIDIMIREKVKDSKNYS